MTTITMANTSAGPYLAPAQVGHFLEVYLATISGWQIAATMLIILVAYDQCPPKLSPGYSMIRTADLA
jgi:sterol 22-desaturase